jgi:hypothetical protein
MLYVGVAVLMILDRPFPFVLMNGGGPREGHCGFRDKNSEKFGNNSAGSNVPRAFVRTRTSIDLAKIN